MTERTRVLIKPTLREARESIIHEIQKKPLIVIHAFCETMYEGRGASRASGGDRVVIIKPDGSLIVHGPRGFKPLNWQPDSISLTVLIEDNALVIKSVRRTVKEILVIRCFEIEALVLTSNPVEGEFYMYLSEREIKEVIKENPWIVEEGFQVVDSEKPLESGIADLYGRDRNGRPVVVEVKRVKATEEAVRQLATYIEALRARGVAARGLLLAPEASENALKLASLYGIEFRVLDLRKLYEIAKTSRLKSTLIDYMSEREKENQMIR